MSSVTQEISKSIKEGCWLDIEYLNANNQTTYYWCAINDINIDKKLFKVDIFNYEKDSEIIEGYIYFERIKNAKVLSGTTYDVPKELYKKIGSNINKLDWLGYENFSANILDYLKECYLNDVDPCSKPTDMIEGIDYDILKSEAKYKLSLTQLDKIMNQLRIINKINIDENTTTTYELILNIFSIATIKGKYTVAYKKVLFNPKDKTLVLNDEIFFNKSFLIEGSKYSLSYYLDVNAEEFVNEFTKNQEEYQQMIRERLRYGEKEDERPYLELLQRNVFVNIDAEYNAIKELHRNNKLPLSLKAFFGDFSSRNVRRKNFPIALYDNNVNVDQLRVINNAMKNPITYVQGPPGTGKTYTILNVIVSAFYNDRTVLITSNNNKPITAIYEKISKLKYGKEGKVRTIPFPILRLGNFEEVKNTLFQIKDLIEVSKNGTAFDEVLNSIKQNQENNLKKLNEILDNYEHRLEIEDELAAVEDFVNELSKRGNSLRALGFHDKIQKLKDELNKLEIIKDEDARQYAYTSEKFTTWIYYTAIKKIKKLDEPKYEELRSILKFDETDEASIAHSAQELNKYLKVDNNLSMFLKVFPIVATTNMSCNKLGSPNPHFDLTIMDEAGQCSIAMSLPALVRSESLLLVGDQNQLQPVVVLDKHLNYYFMKKYKIDDCFNYCDNSILKLMCNNDEISKFILLRYHYRCQDKIIQFSNRKYYDNQLICKTKLDDKTNEQLISSDIKTVHHTNEKNTSIDEAVYIIDKIKNEGLKDVGVVTPFRNQADLIAHLAKEYGLNQIEVGTIHTFQGGEKEQIFISCAITPKSKDKTFNWVKDNKELINVAVTRAKNQLFVVGDYEEIEKKSNNEVNDIIDLVKYVKDNGTSQISVKEESILKRKMGNLKQLNSSAEEELLGTLVQILSIDDKYKVKEKIKASSVLADCVIEDMKYFLECEYDFVIFDKYNLPILVIELNGKEHYTSQKVIERDYKKEMLTKNNIKLINIPNNFSRKYRFIKEYISKILEE